jgi:uroporphyrinogen decarboxylase
MTSRERILTAIRHQEPDRVPYDLSATPVTGIHEVAYRRLRRALGLPERDVTIWHQMQQLAWVDDDVHAAMETDARGLRPKVPSTWQLELSEDERYTYFTDDWGVTRRKQKTGGYYFDLCASPLADATSPDDIARYAFPDPVHPSRFDGIRPLAERMQSESKAFVLGGICAGMFEMGQWLRGFENFYCDLAGNRALAEALCDKIIELKMRYWETVLPLVGDLVDVVQEGDDYGGQNGILVSPRIFREVFKPRLRQLLFHIKRLAPHVSVFFHTCGAVREILPDLIEVGVDILNPVQVACFGMDSKELKREFGKSLTFWGGGVDTQRVLPTGTPEQVRDEAKRRIDDFAPGGGFVFATVHNIQADVSAENILAMRQAARDCGGYPRKDEA